MPAPARPTVAERESGVVDPEQKPWEVHYSVDGFPDQVRSYDTEEEAVINRDDITGYEGVSNVRIVDKSRPTLLQRVLEDE